MALQILGPRRSFLTMTAAVLAAACSGCTSGPARGLPEGAIAAAITGESGDKLDFFDKSALFIFTKNPDNAVAQVLPVQDGNRLAYRQGTLYYGVPGELREVGQRNRVRKLSAKHRAMYELHVNQNNGSVTAIYNNHFVPNGYDMPIETFTENSDTPRVTNSTRLYRQLAFCGEQGFQQEFKPPSNGVPGGSTQWFSLNPSENTFHSAPVGPITPDGTPPDRVTSDRPESHVPCHNNTIYQYLTIAELSDSPINGTRLHKPASWIARTDTTTGATSNVQIRTRDGAPLLPSTTPTLSERGSYPQLYSTIFNERLWVADTTGRLFSCKLDGTDAVVEHQFQTHADYVEDFFDFSGSTLTHIGFSAKDDRKIPRVEVYDLGKHEITLGPIEYPKLATPMANANTITGIVGMTSD